MSITKILFRVLTHLEPTLVRRACLVLVIVSAGCAMLDPFATCHVRASIWIVLGAFGVLGTLFAGKIQVLLLAVLYYLVVTPVAVLWRLSGQSIQKEKPPGDSYWVSKVKKPDFDRLYR